EVGPQARVEGEADRPEPLPALQVDRGGQGDARPQRPPAGVGHHIAVKGGHEGDPRVLDPAAAAVPLPQLLRLQHHPEPLHPGGHAVVEADPGQPDPRVVALGDQAREQVQLPVGAAGAGRVAHPPGLAGVVRVGGHDHAEAADRPTRRRERVRCPRPPLIAEPRLEARKWRWNTRNSTTAGTARTTAPARMAPKGLAWRPDTVEMKLARATA